MLLWTPRATTRVNLDDFTGSTSSTGTESRLDFIVDQDGNTYRRNNSGTPTQINDPNWLRPTSLAPGNYQVRYTGATNITGATSAEDSWYDLSTSDWFIWVTDTVDSPASVNGTATVEIGIGGNAIASCTIDLTANRDSS